MTNTSPNGPLRLYQRNVSRGSRRAFSKTVPKGSLPTVLFFLIVLLLPVGHSALGQALPAAEASPISTGFELPRVQGSLQYSISANESISDGYYGISGIDASTGLSGDLAYISNSKIYPFSMVFSGGRYWSTSDQPSTTFLNLGLSQVINTRNWVFVLSDSVSYLPQTPSTGLSGVPGTGDLGIPPVQIGDQIGQGVLTGYSTRVSNSAAASAQLKLTGKTSIQVSGNDSILRFVGSSSGDGLDTNSESGTIGLSHRIDARNSLSGNYAYMQFVFGANQPGFSSQTASMDYTHQFSRKLDMDLSVGPQWSGSTGAGQGTPATPAIPTSVNAYVSASLTYAAEFTNFGLSYSRGTSGGYGVILGAHSDSVSFRASRTFERVWNGAVNSAYTHTTGLAPVESGTAGFSSQTGVASAQISRALGRSLSVYASYTLEDQAIPSSSAAVDAFSGFFQVASFGLTYSPNLIHLGSR